VLKGPIIMLYGSAFHRHSPTSLLSSPKTVPHTALGSEGRLLGLGGLSTFLDTDIEVFTVLDWSVPIIAICHVVSHLDRTRCLPSSLPVTICIGALLSRVAGNTVCILIIVICLVSQRCGVFKPRAINVLGSGRNILGSVINRNRVVLSHNVGLDTLGAQVEVRSQDLALPLESFEDQVVASGHVVVLVGVQTSNRIVSGEAFLFQHFEDHVFIRNLVVPDYEPLVAANWLEEGEPLMLLHLVQVVSLPGVCVQDLVEQADCIL
jgi:hypothetical protein